MIDKKVIVDFSVCGRRRGLFTGKVVEDKGAGMYGVRFPVWQAKALSAAGITVFGSVALLWADEFKEAA